MDDKYRSSIEKLLNTPYWIIDILPEQVPKDSPGQYFPIEKYFLSEQSGVIKQKHINMVLKLNCYMDIFLEEEKNPAPERIAEMMKNRYIYIMIGESMILSEPDDTHLTLFHPDDRLLTLVKNLAESEGLFVWKGGNE